MKKLNNMELEAISEQICDKLEAAAKEEQKLLDTANDAMYEKNAKLMVAELLNLCVETKKYLTASTRNKELMNFDNIKDSLCVKQTKVSFGYGYQHRAAVKRKLIIAQIDSTDIDDMINKVTDTFIN
ncbi:MAG: hypothetical protein DRH06_00320 [Deltaproteobacteria bacterium]|nr:MAG: hypothetical protein DRH06_00320 [Deltaproteobacteria bacterium]